MNNIFPDNISNLKLIGSGGYGKVYDSGKDYVIKELHKQLDDTINNINKYSALVQNKGIPVFERNISEKKINELLKEYEETFAKSVKKIVSVSTAFGKMQYLIEEQELKEAKPFYYTIGNN